jgi:serine/threonine protein kinase
VLHQIGIGTLGPVFRTYEPTRDRLVAVKVFRLDIVPEQAQALALALAKAAQASLFHPSIVEPIDAGVEGTLAYRAEEYVAAESLDVAMRHYAPAPLEKVLPFITQLSGAIDFARAAGIGHGGLHPRDIFVTPDEARATGFGVVEALEQVGIRAPIRRPYSAPERIAGTSWSTPADVFSLAAITFELLTAKRPSGTGSEIGVLPESAQSTALHAVLARAMHEDAAKRYPSALGFAAALEAASQGRPLTDAAVPVAESPGPPALVSETLIHETRVPDVPVAERRAPEPGPSSFASESLVPNAPAEQPSADEATIAAATPLPLAALGEFEIEDRLDPIHEAVDDVTVPLTAPPAVVHTPTLFHGGHDEAQRAELGKRRFTEDFVEEEPRRVAPVEPPMFGAGDPEQEDRSRSPMLPYALILVVGLLAGFGGGYFMASRDRVPEHQQAARAAAPTAGNGAAATSPPAPTGSAATPERPGQYSEQKVAPPSPVRPNEAPPSRPAAARPSPPPAAAAAPPREVAATKGQLVVRSQPAHAGVTINGTWRGRTPLTIDNLAFGTYTVRVVQPGYVVAREEVALNARNPARSLMTRLERTGREAAPAPAPSRQAAAAAAETFTGSLFVDSRPRGATVLLDGRNVGQTPVSVPDVAVGGHVVRIEMDGKKPVMANPRVVSGKTERVTVSLEDK